VKRITAYFVYILLNTVAASAQYLHVLELFTYDGCASCILANRKIKRLHDEGYFEKNGILQLTYHVDFEASDGFTDSLNSEFNRQRLLHYKNRGLVDGLYTPVMVLDGAFAFPAAKLSVIDSLLRVSKTSTKREFPIINNTHVVVEDDSLVITSSFNDAFDLFSEVEVLSILVKKEDRQHILSGENSGAMRYDVNAVFAAILAQNEVCKLSTKAISGNLNLWQLILLKTHRSSGEIIGFDTYQLH
jgi:hypothetical protein